MANMITSYTSDLTGRKFRIEITPYVSASGDTVYRWAVMNTEKLFFDQGYARTVHIGIGTAIGMADLYEHDTNPTEVI